MAPSAEQTAVDAEKARRLLELFHSEGPAACKRLAATLLMLA
jgi:hypothetical protein